MVDRAVQAADRALWTYGYSSRAERSGFLRVIAREIEARGATLTAQRMKETGLP